MHRMLIVFRLEKYYAFEFPRTSFYLNFFRDKSIRTNINTKRRPKFIENPNEDRSFYIIFVWLINNFSIGKETVQNCESDIYIIIPWKFIMNRRKKPNHFPHRTFSFSLIFDFVYDLNVYVLYVLLILCISKSCVEIIRHDIIWWFVRQTI